MGARATSQEVLIKCVWVITGGLRSPSDSDAEGGGLWYRVMCTHAHACYFLYKNKALASPKLQFKSLRGLNNYLVFSFGWRAGTGVTSQRNPICGTNRSRIALVAAA